ncbi:MAG: PilN family type IVB pilus formation outer membrane protein [Burkholderiales bacterium]|nr:PilN family type IVB pilus formation outer membrane protein [Burkholderiales bacterium]
MKISKINIVLQLSLLSLFGCSFTHLPSDVQKSISSTESGIDGANRSIAQAKNKQADNFIKHSNTGFFGNQVIVGDNASILPPVFNNPIQLDQQYFGLRSISSSITDLTQIPTMIDLSSDDNDVCRSIRVTQQTGNLIDLLNLIAAKCDIGWTYKGGNLVLSDTQTKTWDVKGIPGDTQVQNQIQNQTGIQGQSGANGTSSGSGGGGGSTGQSQANANQSTTQNIAFNLQNNLWQNLKDGIQAILSKTGKVSISPATSSLTVTDRPSVLLRVDQYMHDQNATLKRMVMIDVQVYNVAVTKQDNYGINWNLVLAGAGSSFSVNGAAVTPGTVGGTSTFSPSPVFIPSNTTQAFTFGVPTTAGTALSGSQLIINALSQQNKTSLVTSTAVTTISNQPVPVQFVNQQSYLSSVSTTVTGSAGTAQTALTPGQLTTGFSLNILPVIEENGNVNMQLALNVSSLTAIQQFSSNGSSIQLPQTSQSNLMQKVIIKSGDTFVVSGFDSNNNQITNTGVGGIYNWIFGGGVSAQNVRNRMIVLVTPHVVDTQ